VGTLHTGHNGAVASQDPGLTLAEAASRLEPVTNLSRSLKRDAVHGAGANRRPAASNDRLGPGWTTLWETLN